ncbi:MAG: hypothetical protein RL685_2762 [Pseudomonadota bacterium]|jgi:hypothetical protein
MLPPFIIEQIRRREEAQRRKSDAAKQPRLELPIDLPEPASEPDSVDEDRHRGVVVVDL